jgi:hypothetical protein
MAALPKDSIASRAIAHTAFSEEVPLSRRRRYARSPAEALCVSLTPIRLNILRFLAELKFLSLPQIARLCCPSSRQDLAEKSARRQMRMLFDAGLVDVLPVSRAALAPAGQPNDASLLYGSAPNVYASTALGLETLHRAGLTEKPDAARRKPAYGPKNSLFLAHELAVRDVRVWLELMAREGGHELECWKDGESAAIDLNRDQPPFSVRPDAWFVLRLGQVVLVGLVEVDRGTERGERRWREKLDAYGALFASGRLPAVTGYINARILVITSDGRRRDQISIMVEKFSNNMASRYWIAEKTVLEEDNFLLPQWRQHVNLALQPLFTF